MESEIVELDGRNPAADRGQTDEQDGTGRCNGRRFDRFAPARYGIVDDETDFLSQQTNRSRQNAEIDERAMQRKRQCPGHRAGDDPQSGNDGNCRCALRPANPPSKSQCSNGQETGRQ
ncbi:MAG TPA: hypothetical protein VGH81_07175 [Rudaea sp.]